MSLTTMSSMLPEYTPLSGSNFTSAAEMAKNYEAANPFKTLSDAFSAMHERNEKERDRIENQRRYDQEFAIKQATENRAQQTHELGLEDRLRGISQEEATNMALATLNNPENAQNLQGFALDANSGYALAKAYDDMVAKGMSPQDIDKAIMSNYNKMAQNQNLYNPNVKQDVMFDANDTLAKKAMEERKQNEVEAQNKRSNAIQWAQYNANQQANTKQDKLASAILNAINNGTVSTDEDNPEYKKLSDEYNQAKIDLDRQNTLAEGLDQYGDVSGIENLTPKEVASLTKEIEAERDKLARLEAANKARQNYNENYGSEFTMDENTGQIIENKKLDMLDTTPAVNARLEALSKDNPKLYSAVMEDPSLLSKLHKSKDILKSASDTGSRYNKLQEQIKNTPEKIKNVTTKTAKELFDENKEGLDATSQLQLLQLLNSSSLSLGNTTSGKKSSSSGKNKDTVNSLFNSTSEKEPTVSELNYENKQKAEADKIQVDYDKLNKVNTPTDLNAFTNYLNTNGISTYEGYNAAKSIFFGEDNKPKNQGAINKGIIENTIINKVLDLKDDKDRHTSTNLTNFLAENEKAIAKMSPAEITAFIDRFKVAYADEGKHWYNNMYKGSPIGDALQQTIDNHYKDILTYKKY